MWRRIGTASRSAESGKVWVSALEVHSSVLTVCLGLISVAYIETHSHSAIGYVVVVVVIQWL